MTDHERALERARKEFPHVQEQVRQQREDREWFLRHGKEVDLVQIDRDLERMRI